MSLLRVFFLATTTLLAPVAAVGETRLMMVEQEGCSYCERWHAEVGPEYPKTAEGLAAPLLSQDLHASLPEGVALISPPVFTPTFVLLVDGVETRRIEGYPGEEFFWGLLGQMLADAGQR